MEFFPLIIPSWKVCERFYEAVRSKRSSTIPVTSKIILGTWKSISPTFLNQSLLFLFKNGEDIDKILHLPILPLQMTEDECSSYDDNYRSYEENVEKLKEDYDNMWILYKDGKVIDTHKSLYDGWLCLLVSNPDKVTSILTIPGQRFFYPSFFDQQPHYSGSITTFKYADLIYPNGNPVIKKNKELQYVVDTGSAHCVVHYKNLEGSFSVAEVSIPKRWNEEKRRQEGEWPIKSMEYEEQYISTGKTQLDSITLEHREKGEEFSFVIVEDNNKYYNRVILGYHGFLDRTSCVIIGKHHNPQYHQSEREVRVYRQDVSARYHISLTIDEILNAHDFYACSEKPRWQFFSKVMLTSLSFDVLIDTGSRYNFLPSAYGIATFLKKNEDGYWCAPDNSETWRVKTEGGGYEEIDKEQLMKFLKPWQNETQKLHTRRIFEYLYEYGQFGFEVPFSSVHVEKENVLEREVFLLGRNPYATLGAGFIDRFVTIVIGDGCVGSLVTKKGSEHGLMLLFKRKKETEGLISKIVSFTLSEKNTEYHQTAEMRRMIEFWGGVYEQHDDLVFRLNIRGLELRVFKLMLLY